MQCGEDEEEIGLGLLERIVPVFGLGDQWPVCHCRSLGSIPCQYMWDL